MLRISVHDLNGHLLGYIDQYSNLCQKRDLDSWPELSFDVPANSKTTRLLQNELRLKLGNEVFVVKSCQPSRDKSGPILKVTAPSTASDLNYKPRQVVGTYLGTELYSNWAPYTRYEVNARVRYYGVVYECRQAHTSGNSLSGSQWSYWTTCKIQAELVELVMTLPEFIDFALQDTGWKRGKIDDDGASRTFSGTWVSVPSLLAEGCEKFDRHVVYHSDTQTVDMVIEPGVDRGATIEYAKNLTGISKSSDSTDFITKLYAYGDEELTFNLVNVHPSNEHPLYQLQNLQSFILDFSFFHAQGYTDDDIYASVRDLGDGSPFIRLSKLDMSDYVDDAALLRDAKKKLNEELAHPVVTYKVDFVNLADVLVDPNEDIDIGDWVWVRDYELGVDIKARVTSMTIYPGYPEKSTAQLSNKNEFFGNTIASTIGYTQQLSSNSTVSNMLKNYINTFTTIINSGKGDLVWSDGQLTAIELDANGKPTGNQVRLTPTGLGVSTNYGATYDNAITGAGVLANKVIADSLHILSVGSDGIVIEPQTSGVRLNNTEGIVVQSKDKRFTAKMQASDDMSGSSWGFSLYNGEFAQPTITTSGGYFRVNGYSTNISYFSNYQTRVASNGRWYIYRPTSLKVEDTIDKATRLPVLSNRSGYLYIGGRNTGIPYQAGLDVIAGDDGNWLVGYNSGVTAQYQGQSLVFGVNMNGDAYFNGVVKATDFQNQNGQSILNSQGKIDKNYLDLGNIKLDGRTGNISLTGAITIGDYPTCGIYLNGAGSMYMTGDMHTSGNLNLGGNVSMTGNITMGGSIRWQANNSPVKILYSEYDAGTPYYSYDSYPNYSSRGWHKMYDNGWDKFVSYSYDGGNTWTPAMKTVGEDGQDGEPGEDANVTRGNIARALYEGSPDYMNDGIYSYYQYGRYYLAINASYILAGDIDADNIALTCSMGGFCKGYGSTGFRRTYGSMMYGSNGPDLEPYFIVTDAGCRMSAQNDEDLFVTGGGVYASSEITVRSDRRVKHDIEYSLGKYETFFRNLKPTQYKFDNGQSDRYHLGFIAQDVEQCLLNSGLTTKDFAGLVIAPVEEFNPKDNIVDNYYKLRYAEFIALNTHMIQRLLDRVDNLEQILNMLLGLGQK